MQKSILELFTVFTDSVPCKNGSVNNETIYRKCAVYTLIGERVHMVNKITNLSVQEKVYYYAGDVIISDRLNQESQYLQHGCVTCYGIIIDEDHSFDHMFQLTDIPLSIVLFHCGEGFFRENDFGLVFFVEFCQEKINQRYDVLGSFFQRRNLEFDGIQPIIKIFAESAFINKLFQLLVGGAISLISTVTSFVPPKGIKV